MGNAATRAKNKYNEENYERISLSVKKGSKSLLQAVAEAHDGTLNGYIKEAIKAKFKTDTGEDIEL